MTLLVGILLAATTGLSVTPGVRVSGGQLLGDEMRSAYGLVPELGLSARFEQTRYMALLLELCGDYGSSFPWTGSTSLYSASLRTGLEFRSSPANEFYVTPGLQLTHAAEQYPSYDTTSGIISRRWYGGTGIGAFVNAGGTVLRVRDWGLGIEFGITLVSVPTDYPLDYYGGYSYGTYSITRSSLDLGLVVRKSARLPAPEE